MLRREPQRLAPHFLSPLRGLLVFLAVFLGLTPQANHLPPLRGSGLTPQANHLPPLPASLFELRRDKPALKTVSCVMSREAATYA